LQPLKPVRTSSSQISVPGSRLAVAGDSVFFTSNMGVVGSIDAANGDIRWLAKYSEARQPEPVTKSPREETAPQFIWHETPPKIVLNQTITVGGQQTKANVLYVAPRDSDRLYAFNADTGARIWERCLADNVPLAGDASDYRRVVFSDDFALVLQNVTKQTDAAVPIDAEKYAPKRIMLFELATGKEINFNCRIPNGETIACAPAFSGRYVFVATDKSLYVFDTSQNAKTAANTLLTNLVDINPLREIRLVGNKLLLFNEERVFCYSLAP
jgi:outer membrane protein assembly factor BamB